MERQGKHAVRDRAISAPPRAKAPAAADAAAGPAPGGVGGSCPLCGCRGGLPLKIQMFNDYEYVLHPCDRCQPVPQTPAEG